MSNYHDPRQPSQEELDEIGRKFTIKDGRLFNIDREIYADTSISTSRGYLRTWATVDGKQRCYMVHHITWFLHKNEWPKHQLDHKDLNKLNYNIDNLRYSTSSVQNLNKKRIHDLPHGVYKSGWKRYVAEIQFKNQRIPLGVFDSSKSAGAAYKNKYKELHGVELDV